MTAKKSFIRMLMAEMIFCSIFSVSANHAVKAADQTPAYGEFAFNSNASITAINNHKLIYSMPSENYGVSGNFAMMISDSLNYYVHDFISGTDSFVGSIKRAFSSSGKVVVLDNTVFFRWDIISESTKNDPLTANLFCTDIDKKSIQVIDDRTIADYFLSSFDDQLLYIRRDEVKYSALHTKTTLYLDCYNPKKEKLSNIFQKNFESNNYQYSGSEILQLSPGQPGKNEFYTLEEQYPLKTEYCGNYVLCKYNKDGKLLETIDANCLANMAMKDSINKVQYLGNSYFYVSTFYEHSLCRIENGVLKVAKAENSGLGESILAYGTFQADQTKYVFFDRWKDMNIHVFDTSTGKWETIPVNREGCSSIICVYADTENNLLLCLHTEDWNEVCVYTSLNELKK